MLICFAVIWLYLYGICQGLESPVKELILDLASYGNNEINLLIDDEELDTKMRTAQSLQQNYNLPIHLYHLGHLMVKIGHLNPKCPIFDTSKYYDKDTAEVYNENELHQPIQLLPSQSFRQTFVIWSSEFSKRDIMKILDHSVLDCSQKIAPGMFHNDNRFLFILDRQQGVEDAEEIFKTSKYAKRHRHVVVAKRFQESEFLMFTYSFQNDGHNVVTLRYRWNPFDKPETLDKFYGDSISDLKRKVVTVSTIPWPFFVSAEIVPKTKNPPDHRLYENHRGMEIDILHFMEEAFNFKADVTNPIDGSWGRLSDNGTWNGLTGEAAKGSAEIILSGVYYTWARSQVIHSSVFYLSDYISIAAPTPKQVSKLLAIINPFDRYVWTGLFLSTAFMTIFLPMMSKLEHKYVPKSRRKKNIDPAFIFRCLLGEPVTDETSAAHGKAVR